MCICKYICAYIYMYIYIYMCVYARAVPSRVAARAPDCSALDPRPPSLKPSHPRLVPARPKFCARHVREPLRVPSKIAVLHAPHIGACALLPRAMCHVRRVKVLNTLYVVLSYLDCLCEHT
jgi:hypothetical protein